MRKNSAVFLSNKHYKPEWEGRKLRGLLTPLAKPCKSHVTTLKILQGLEPLPRCGYEEVVAHTAQH